MNALFYPQKDCNPQVENHHFRGLGDLYKKVVVKYFKYLV